MTEVDVLLLSNSEIRCYKRCRRKWWLTHFRRLVLKRESQAGPRALGSAVHVALEELAKGGQGDPLGRLAEWYEAAVALTQDNGDRADKVLKDYEFAQRMVEGYLEWAIEEGIDQDLEVVGAEEIIQAELAEGVWVRGKVDQRLRRISTGKRLIRDFKTTGSVTEPVKTLHSDEQQLMYLMIERMLGRMDERAEAGLHTMLRRVKRTAAAKPPFYAQHEVRHSDVELRSFWRRTLETARDIQRLRERLEAVDGQVTADGVGVAALVAYPSPEGSCSWSCDFFAVCPLFDEGSDAEGAIAEWFEVGDPDARYADKVEGTEE